ncbi:D-alanyl-D-alanine carboxypeptidase [Bacillus sp. BGMRC 2118]|nr:D-alanyl-D-alanine carboxypeptidase [Bacillus sp. BGMRC 2118]
MKHKLYMVLFSCILIVLLATQFDVLQTPSLINNTTFSESNLPAGSSIIGEAALLIDDKTGEVVYSKNEDKKLFPASTTKILTALVALKYGNINDQITVGNEVQQKTPGESTAWLTAGKTFTLQELLAGLMLPSGNDAARTIAVYIGKKEMNDMTIHEQEAIDYFSELMNKEAKKLGATRSHFMNPHGLHHPNHYSTAHDLGIIAREAMDNEDFKALVSQPTFSNPTLTYENKNQLVNPESPYHLEGANGIKTGYTDEAGYCLVSSAEHNGKKLIAVVLKSTKQDVWNDSISLLTNGFTSSYVKK